MAKKLCRNNGVEVPPDGELCHDYYLKDDQVEVKRQGIELGQDHVL